MLSVWLFCILCVGIEAAEKKSGAHPSWANKEVGDITGYYSVDGKEASGKKYHGIASIIKRGEVYIVTWVVEGNSFAGVGIRQGDVLAVGWAISGERLVRGVNLYRIEPGPRLVGRWASAPGPGIVQNETLSFVKSLALPGD